MAKSKQVLALAARNIGHKRPLSPLQSRSAQNMAACAHAWSLLPIPGRAQWQALANQMNHQTGLRTPAGLKQKRPMTAYMALCALNATLLASGQELNPVAPQSVTKPDAFPPLLLHATSTMSGEGDTTLPFTLTITSTNFGYTTQIYAAPPALAGQYPDATKAVLIAALPALIPGVNNLAPAYAARFGPLQDGQQVVLVLVPISDEGFKGVPMTISATVNAPALPARAQSGPLSLKSA